MLPKKTLRIAQRKSGRVLFQRLQRLARRTADSAVHIHRADTKFTRWKCTRQEASECTTRGNANDLACTPDLQYSRSKTATKDKWYLPNDYAFNPALPQFNDTETSRSQAGNPPLVAHAHRLTVCSTPGAPANKGSSKPSLFSMDSRSRFSAPNSRSISSRLTTPLQGLLCCSSAVMLATNLRCCTAERHAEETERLYGVPYCRTRTHSAGEDLHESQINSWSGSFCSFVPSFPCPWRSVTPRQRQRAGNPSARQDIKFLYLYR